MSKHEGNSTSHVDAQRLQEGKVVAPLTDALIARHTSETTLTIAAGGTPQSLRQVKELIAFARKLEADRADLYAALERLLSHGEDDAGNGYVEITIPREDVEQARSALNKAKGE